MFKPTSIKSTREQTATRFSARRVYSQLSSPYDLTLSGGKLLHGRAGLINSGGASAGQRFEEAVNRRDPARRAWGYLGSQGSDRCTRASHC
jgi:hypothetical protein